MALEKTETIYNGETVSYHRITGFEVDLATGASYATLKSWGSYVERADNQPAKLSRRFIFQWQGEDVHADAYAAIKQLHYWQDATDV